MTGIYFSGTGNTKHCIETFLNAYEPNAKAYPIEEKKTLEQIQKEDVLVFAYPVQYSNLPKIVRDFVLNNSSLWKDKKIFIIATMGLFSGDGSGNLARLLKKQGAEILGGIHIKMPDSISDEKALKRPLEENRELVKAGEVKLIEAAQSCKNHQFPQIGLSFIYHLAGLFGQRLYFMNKTKHYSDKLKIDTAKCIGCGLCESLCPMENIRIIDGIAKANSSCTMCYRCISKCPQQAITLLGKKIVEQVSIDNYTASKE